MKKSSYPSINFGYFSLKSFKTIFLFFFLLLSSTTLNGQCIFIQKIDNCEKIHYSYETKLAEYKHGWVEELIVSIETNKPKRTVLDRNFQIYPFILFPGDTLKVSLKKNIPTASNNNPDWAFYKQLEDKYKIIMSPFFGINYDEKTNYNVIYDEIQKMRENRLAFLKKR